MLAPHPSAYAFIDMARLVAAPILDVTRMTARLLEAASPQPFTPASLAVAQLQTIERTLRPYRDPGFGIKLTTGESVEERELSDDPWLRLTHFPKSAGRSGRPRHVLLLAPSSGHHPSLLRQTAARLREHHDVAVAGWSCASTIPLAVGPLNLDIMVDRILDAVRIYREATGAPDIDLLAVCQPAPLALIAATILEARGEALASLTLMGGPIDPAAAPTLVSNFAQDHSLAWFEKNSIDTVPLGRSGAGRRVYPGYRQLAAFVAMQPGRHAEAMHRRFLAAWQRDMETTAKGDAFYDDYCAVADLPAEFYLETIERVFRRRDLPTGRFDHRGARIDPASLEHTALMVIEGELDDICAAGQTAAAFDLTPRIPATRRRYLVAVGAGHYGLFSGSRWRNEIAPEFLDFLGQAGRRPHRAAARGRRRP